MEYSSATQRLLTVLEFADRLASHSKESVDYTKIFYSDVKNKLKDLDILEDVEKSIAEEAESLQDIVIQYSDFFKAITIILEVIEEKTKFKFFKLVVEAIEEVNSIKRISNNTRSQKDLEKLSNLLLAGGNLDLNWWKFNNELESMGAYTILNSLSEALSSQHTVLPLLPQDILGKIMVNFQEIIDEVTESNLTQELKIFIVKNTEELLKTVKSYKINGSEGIRNVTQVFMANWMTIESKIDRKDLGNPTLKRVVSRFAVLNMFLGLDLISGISLIPDLESYWAKRFESYLPIQKAIEIKSAEESLSLQEIINEASRQFDEHMQNKLEGSKEPKALPPGPELDES